MDISQLITIHLDLGSTPPFSDNVVLTGLSPLEPRRWSHVPWAWTKCPITLEANGSEMGTWSIWGGIRVFKCFPGHYSDDEELKHIHKLYPPMFFKVSVVGKHTATSFRYSSFRIFLVLPLKGQQRWMEWEKAVFLMAGVRRHQRAEWMHLEGW